MKKVRPILLFPLLAVLASCWAGLSARADITLSRHGVTWTIAGNPTHGTYCTGDPWVVGPVTITAITPAWDGTRNGTMLNPSAETDTSGNVDHYHSIPNGWDTRIWDFGQWTYYSAAHNAALQLPSLSVPVNTSVVSTRGIANATGRETKVENYAILTVVESAPPADSFRPPPYGSEQKTTPWRESQINYGALNKLSSSAVASTLPSLSDMSDRMLKPWIFRIPHDVDEQFHAANMSANNTGYGMQVSLISGTAGLMLNLDFSNAQKRDLLLGTLQCAIDELYLLKRGAVWFISGGHNSGRWTPIIVAAGCLGSEFITYNVPTKYQEGLGTFFLTPEYWSTPMGTMQTCDGQYVRRSVNCGLVTEFSQVDTADPTGNQVGSAWIKLGSQVYHANNTWSGANNAYIDIASASLTGPTMTARAMGLRAAINHEAMFLYADRVAATGWSHAYWYNPTPEFHKAFYAAFKNAPPPTSGPDTRAPILSSITTDNVGAANATITWNTDESATSGVDYGLTTSYGGSATNATLSSFHSITLTGLQPSTTYHYRVISTDGSTNRNVSVSGDYTFTTRGTNYLSTPVITPSGASSVLPVQISIDADDGASVFYTLDGSIPDADSLLYSGPFPLSSSSSLRAIAMKPGFTNSEIAGAEFEINQFPVQTRTWRNIPLPVLTDLFTLSFDVISPQSAAADAVIGLSKNAAGAYPNLAVIARLNIGGTIDVRNGDSYMATNTVAYDTTSVYRITISGSTDTHTFTATVSANGGPPVLLWADATFRSEQSTVDYLNNLGVYSTGGECIVSDVTVQPSRRPTRPLNLRFGSTR